MVGGGVVREGAKVILNDGQHFRFDQFIGILEKVLLIHLIVRLVENEEETEEEGEGERRGGEQGMAWKAWRKIRGRKRSRGTKGSGGRWKEAEGGRIPCSYRWR